MNDTIFNNIPEQYQNIATATKAIEFNMASDLQTGSLLKTLVASKKSGRFLEIGTGTGLATAWIIDGMDVNSKLVSIDNNELLINIAKQQLVDDRIEFICADGYNWINNYKAEPFDLIFADAMPGKYDLFEEALGMLKSGGFCIIDDMLPQPNWPEGHDQKANLFIEMLEARKDMVLTKLNWSTGIIIITKK